ncbi:hypothetical protein PMAYCL1PPCAC_21552, partial [Pristionchus mayeri]
FFSFIYNANFRSLETGEDWGSNVSLVPNHASFSCWSIVLRVGLGLFFLALGVVAVVYSIENAEVANQAEKEFFPWNTDQECAEGNMTVYTIVEEDGYQSAFEVTTTPIIWIQDARSSKLFYQVGVGADVKYKLFIYETIGYNVSHDFAECVRVPGLTYKSFFAGLGLVDIPKKDHLEELIIDGHLTKVNAYEGEPPLDTLVMGERPSLIFAYSAIAKNITYQWQIFFPRDSTLSRIDYWFEDMQPRTEDASIFNDLPEKCLDL